MAPTGTARNVPPPPPYRPPPNDALDLLYADTWLLMANKPAGLLSVPGRGEDKQDCLVLRVQAEYPDALIVHRLDLPTSGLLLLARGKEMQRRLSHEFAQRRVDKRYLAVVMGRPLSVTGTIDLPLAVDWPNHPRQKVDRRAGKPALTRYRFLSHSASDDTSRLALSPETGRTHQLRVHLQALGHPIVGDRLYADATTAAKFDRLLLHAEELSFTHPATDRRMRFCSPPPF